MEAELSEEQVADKKWLAQRLAYEERPENAIVVENPPKHWHEKLVAIKAQFRKMFAANKALTGRHHEYGRAEINGRIFSAGGIRVSIATCDRALSIANALVMASERRDCEIAFDDHKGRLILKLEQTTLTLEICERQKREPIDRQKLLVSLDQEKLPIPANKLRIVIEKPSWSRSEIVDGSQLVEERLSAIFLRIFQSVVEDRQRVRIENAKKIKRAIEWAAYEELSRQNALVAAQKAQREKDVKDLLSDASRWHDAQNIRGFIAQVESHPAVTNRAAVDAWAQWALKVADETDSLLGRVAALNKDG